jgi:hypothetical protein
LAVRASDADAEGRRFSFPANPHVLTNIGRFFGRGLPRNSKPFADLGYREDVAKQENPAICRASRERLMGLEPTTFCMAIV